MEQVFPQNSYSVLRVDGKNFSKFTKLMRVDSPFNGDFSKRMERVAIELMKEIQNPVAAFVGSDEVSVVFGNLDPKTQKWMGGREQKIVSISAAIATAAFNKGYDSMALFDSRVYDLGTDISDVVEYFNERFMSVYKNSVSMFAYHNFSHSELMHMGTCDRRKLLEENGFDWDALPNHDKHGTFFINAMTDKVSTFVRDGVEQTVTTRRRELVRVERNVQIDENFIKIAISTNPC